MKKLRFSDDLTVPVDWITLATVVYGARGSGKTCFGRVAAEEAHKARQRFCAIDLKGDWYGLKSSADGKRDGIPVVVFGGDHEDLPLEDGAGAFVGETVAGLRQSCILDFENFSKGKRTRFLADFFEALYRRNREPLLLLLDEAQAYAPQKPGPEEARTLGAVQDIVKLGRKHGIGPVLFTQRGAGLNKEVSELCDVMVAFRTPGVIDQERVYGWLDHNLPDVRAFIIPTNTSLAGLPTGSAIFASSHPDLKLSGVHAVRRPETFDSSATPKVGQRRREPKKLADADVEAIRAKMGEAIERRKANDPKLLQARIAELEKQAKARVDPKGLYAQIETLQAKLAEKLKRAEAIKVPVVDKEVVSGLKTALSGVRAVRGVVAEVAQSITTGCNRLAAIAENLEEISKIASRIQVKAFPIHGNIRESARLPREPLPEATALPKPTKRATPTRDEPAPGRSESFSPGQKAVMIAVAQHGSCERPQLRTLTGYKRSTVNRIIGELLQLEYVQRNGSKIGPTESGKNALGEDWEPLPEGADLLAHWLKELPEGPKKVLELLAEEYPGEVPRATICERTGYAKSTVNRILGEMKASRVCTTANGAVRMSEDLSDVP